ncbi:formate dehydrogenase-N subunit alpha [Methylocella silvestris]|uniref:Formate dehydrogenase-N subunit alpha n=1 Tax=Methylocella silvestris TaxID=199596 RepID=A0A2J7TL89_METSI|nr:formate dehydrogenase-N subunit alpha [Methylocella silvestris]
MASLAPTFGRGAMTNTWQDIRNADVVLVMGGNAAEAHPCGFKWVIEAKLENNAKLVVVDPRFTRTASVADFHAPIRPGTDIAFLNGVIRYLLEKDAIQHDYVRAYTSASLIVKDGFGFEDGLFTGYKEDTRSYDKSSWNYDLDEQGFARIDDTWQDPRCVINLLRKHVDRYTPETVSRICGTPQDKYLKVCEMIAATAAPDKALTSLFALGWTQHSVGAQNIRAMAMVQLLLGNIGVAGGGMNALRGHSNIQGLTDVGLLSNQMPGYMTLPSDKEPTFEEYMKTRQFKPLRPGQTSYWQNYRKFFVSFQKAVYGDAARADNDWAYDWLPKLDAPMYDIIRAFDMMANGKINGYICQGFNPLQAFPDKGKIRRGLSKLKFLVTMDPLDTETSRFWENFGPQNPSDPASIATEVFQLPTTCFAEENGSLVNSARWLQWHWKAADGPGEAKSDLWIMSGIFHRMREMYRKDGGAFADPILNLTWNYTDPVEPNPEELAKEMNGKALTEVKDATGAVTLKAGQLLDGFAQLRDDGTTASGCWIFSGCYTEKGNQMARRDASDPREQGIAPNWAWSWPANRRILYNRASADVAGKAWNPQKPIIEWNGSRWAGIDVPDYGPTVKPSEGVGPFIMNAEGVGRLFARDQMAEGPFPEHYEPFESPSPNILHPKVSSNPAARVFADDRAAFGEASEFPYVATTYRLTEHFHYWTKHALINAILQPEEFIEIGEVLAKEKGIEQGGWVRLASKRGVVVCKAYVTKRIKPMLVDGKPTHVIGVPIHWGFTGLARKGYGANTLTPSVGDANTQTPEFKAFLVSIERTTAPVA